MDTRDRVLGLLAGGPMRMKDINGCIGPFYADRQKVLRAMRRLCREGLIELASEGPCRHPKGRAWQLVREDGGTERVNLTPCELPERYDGWWEATGKVGHVVATGVPSREYAFVRDCGEKGATTGERVWVDDEGNVYDG